MSLVKYLALFIGLCLGACQSSQPEFDSRSTSTYLTTRNSRPPYPAYSEDADKRRRERSSFLYPSQERQDLEFVCNKLYSIPQFPRRPFVRESPPELVIVTEDTVTVYFRNDNTQVFQKPDSVDLSRGIYRCP